MDGLIAVWQADHIITDDEAGEMYDQLLNHMEAPGVVECNSLAEFSDSLTTQYPELRDAKNDKEFDESHGRNVFLAAQQRRAQTPPKDYDERRQTSQLALQKMAASNDKSYVSRRFERKCRPAR